MDKWEYKSILSNGPNMEATLSQMGEEGWEAVGLVAVQQRAAQTKGNLLAWVSKWESTRYRVLLKRRKP